LQPGRLIVRKTDGQELEFAVSGGLVEVHNDMLNLLAEAAEPVGEIDEERANEAKARAEDRLDRAEADDSIDRERAKKAWARADNRIKLAREV
jgi:F-type H+-transporting ATPase subunit epsilon